MAVDGETHCDDADRPRVVDVYPCVNMLPLNVLRLYVYFV